jgi:hypothetical protein
MFQRDSVRSSHVPAGFATGKREITQQKELKLTVSPNPFRDEIRINIHNPAGGKILLELICMDGRIIKSGHLKITNSTDLNITWEVKGLSLAPGIYLLKASTGKSITTVRVQKEGIVTKK